MARLLQWLWDRTVRRFMPDDYAVYNGVAVRDVKACDFFTGNPKYKEPLSQLTRAHVSEGDHVVEIGGGRGIVTTIAARRADRVTTYEGSAEMITLLEDTIRTNRVADDITVKNAVVGSANDVYGDYAAGNVVASDSLSGGDILLLDCEGAETDIIPAAADRFRSVVVETHPDFDADTTTVRNLLVDAGHEIVDQMPYGDRKHAVATQESA